MTPRSRCSHVPQVRSFSLDPESPACPVTLFLNSRPDGGAGLYGSSILSEQVSCSGATR